ncbi:MAG TPA: EI24 domain-containing protein [Kofleriaceae bacterium]|nr:EI24 domain-containing protein [Kofleriaceae bacterium]
MIGELVMGVYDGLRGAAYLATHPRLWKWVLAPAIVAALLLFVVIGTTLSALSTPIAAIAAFLPGSWADNLLELAAGIVLTIASFSIFISVAALIAGPFNEELSESVEEHVTGVPGPKFSIGRFLVDLLIGIIHAARRVFVYLVVMGVLLIVGVVVPGIGTVIAAVLGFIATARFASYDAFDAIWSRRRYRYRQKTGYLREHRWRTLGLGAVCAVPLVVPGLNVIALAIGATAATLRVVEQERLRAAVGAATKS